MAKQSPYSKCTMRAFLELGRAMRAVCFSIERCESPASVSRKMRRVRKLAATLTYELIIDQLGSLGRAMVTVNTSAPKIAAAVAVAVVLVILF